MTVFRSFNAAKFTAPEPAPIDVWKDERVAAIDAQLAEIAVIPPPVRTQHQWYQLDRLLDLRHAIGVSRLRPSVPGGTS